MDGDYTLSRLLISSAENDRIIGSSIEVFFVRK